MKGRIETSDGILGGREATFDIKLESGPIQGNFIMDGLGFSKASVEVVCTADIGAGGVAPIQQRNTVNGLGSALATAATIAFTAGDRTATHDLVFSGRYLVVDISALTFNTTGRITVIIVMKL